jgi:uncharacterized membrane protein YgcG
MSDSDGVQISDKASWEHSGRELWVILGKRLLSLPSKMLGFKPFCLYLSTWLLVGGYIRDWIWFAVMVAVLFGIVGLKVITRWRNEHEGFFEGRGQRGCGGSYGGGGSSDGSVFPGEGSGAT